MARATGKTKTEKVLSTVAEATPSVVVAAVASQQQAMLICQVPRQQQLLEASPLPTYEWFVDVVEEDCWENAEE